jgi:hypothetical protein
VPDCIQPLTSLTVSARASPVAFIYTAMREMSKIPFKKYLSDSENRKEKKINWSRRMEAAEN